MSARSSDTIFCAAQDSNTWSAPPRIHSSEGCGTKMHNVDVQTQDIQAYGSLQKIDASVKVIRSAVTHHSRPQTFFRDVFGQTRKKSPSGLSGLVCGGSNLAFWKRSGRARRLMASMVCSLKPSKIWFTASGVSR